MLRLHLTVLRSCRAEERVVSAAAAPKSWQRCFPGMLDAEEVEVRPRRRKHRPRPLVLRGEWAPPDPQMEFWPRPRPPLQRPRSLFARKPLTRLEVAFGKTLVDDLPARMPRSRQQCLGKDEPCPFARCRHHLKIDVNEIGSVKDNFPGWSVLDMEETCSLNVAKQGAQTTERVARLMNLSTERIRQIEREAWRKIARRLDWQRILRGPRRPKAA